MSTDTTNSTTTTARTMRVAVTSSPFTIQKGPRFQPGQATGPPARTHDHDRLTGRLSQWKPAEEPASPGQHRPQLRHRVRRLRLRHQVVDLPNPPPIQKRLSHPNHRHPNPIEPPPPKRRPNLTLQPRPPRPLRHQSFLTTERPPILHHPKLRPHRRPTYLELDGRLGRSLHPKIRLEVRQPPHPRLHPNLPTRQLHPPHRLKDLSHGHAGGSDSLFEGDTRKPCRPTTPIRTMNSSKRKEPPKFRTRGRGAKPFGGCLSV